ncbi:MAG: 7-cyano-7-deazaguanine reductase [Halioglobus sp.]
MASKPELLLGQSTPVVNTYSPQLLYPIDRAEARNTLGLSVVLPFVGVDVWHAYEMSWLDNSGKPVCRVGRFDIPADSANLVESKSFKLYLNSLNSKKFTSDQAAITCIVNDISSVAGTLVTLQLFDVDAPQLSGSALSGVCLDGLDVAIDDAPPSKALLEVSKQRTESKLFSHLLRSLCPVTGQPDWATVWIHYKGRAIEHRSLLRYIIAYREHQEFHEQCVERMFQDLLQSSDAEFLNIQAFYTRRGGLDISPFRSTRESARPQARLNRQ